MTPTMILPWPDPDAQTTLEALRGLMNLAVQGVRASPGWIAAVGPFHLHVLNDAITITSLSSDPDILWRWGFDGLDEDARSRVAEAALGTARVASALRGGKAIASRIECAMGAVVISRAAHDPKYGTRWDVRLGGVPVELGMTIHEREEVPALAAALAGFAFARWPLCPSKLVIQDALGDLGPCSVTSPMMPWNATLLSVFANDVDVQVFMTSPTFPATAWARHGPYRVGPVPLDDVAKLRAFVHETKGLPARARLEAQARWNPEGDLLE